MIKFDGYVSATKWNKDKKVFEIKCLGEKGNGAILCGLNVSDKDKDGNTRYGSPVDMKILIKSEEEADRVYGMIANRDTGLVEFEGFFTANNFTNQEGKEYKGHQILVSDSTTFQKKGTNSAETKVAKVEKPEVKSTQKW